MGLIACVLTGAIAGWLAGRIMHSRGGLCRNILLGTLGGALGACLLGRPCIGGGMILIRLLTATVGACVLILLVRLCRRC